MPKKIFLHLGLHKTGTTSFQQITRINYDYFRNLGVYIPAPVKGIYGSYSGGLHKIPKQLKSGSPLLASLLEDFDRSSCHTLLLSSEMFSRCRIRDIRQLKSLLSKYEVTVLLVMRHPINHAQSLYCSRGHVRTYPPRDFLTSYFKREVKTDPYRSWNTIFPGKVRVLRYENYDNVAHELLKLLCPTASYESLYEAHTPRTRLSTPADLSILNSKLRHFFRELDDEVYRLKIYNNILEMQNLAEYQRSNAPGKKEGIFELVDQERMIEKYRMYLEHQESILQPNIGDGLPYTAVINKPIPSQEKIETLAALFATTYLPAIKVKYY